MWLLDQNDNSILYWEKFSAIKCCLFFLTVRCAPWNNSIMKGTMINQRMKITTEKFACSLPVFQSLPQMFILITSMWINRVRYKRSTDWDDLLLSGEYISCISHKFRNIYLSTWLMTCTSHTITPKAEGQKILLLKEESIFPGSLVRKYLGKMKNFKIKV